MPAYYNKTKEKTFTCSTQEGYTQAWELILSDVNTGYKVPIKFTDSLKIPYLGEVFLIKHCNNKDIPLHQFITLCWHY